MYYRLQGLNVQPDDRKQLHMLSARISRENDTQTTPAIILTGSASLPLRVKGGIGSPDWIFSCHTHLTHFEHSLATLT